MAKKQPKRWAYSPPKPAKPSVPETVKAQVEAKAGGLIDKVLRPQHVRPPQDERFNHVIDIGAKWHRGYYYLFSTYACPGPNALSPTLGSKVARMEHVGIGKFNLFTGLSLDECLKAIRDDPWSRP